LKKSIGISVCDQGAHEVRIGDRSMASAVERLNQLQAWASIALYVVQIMELWVLCSDIHAINPCSRVML
jgi:hypothetical protein